MRTILNDPKYNGKKDNIKLIDIPEKTNKEFNINGISDEKTRSQIEKFMTNYLIKDINKYISIKMKDRSLKKVNEKKSDDEFFPKVLLKDEFSQEIMTSKENDLDDSVIKSNKKFVSKNYNF